MHHASWNIVDQIWRGGGKTIFFHFKKEEEIMSIPEVTNDLSLKVGTDFINLLLFGFFRRPI